MKSFKHFTAFLLIVCLAVFTVGCKSVDYADVPADTERVTTAVKNGDVVGEGEKRFILEITDKAQNTISATVNTDAVTVGEALLALDLITGEEGPYGMYIKSVNGITADYDIDGTYWAFYVNGEYAVTGIDMTEVEDEAVYALKVEK